MAKIEELLLGEMTADPAWEDGATIMWRLTPRTVWINTPYKVGEGTIEQLAAMVSRWSPSAIALGKVKPVPNEP